MANKKDITLKVFAKRLKKLMESNEVTTRELAEHVSLSHSTISRYMRAEMAPKVPTIESIAAYFNVNPVWLLGYNVEKQIKIEEKEPFKEIPILGSIAAGLPVLAEENIKRYEKVPISKVECGNYFYLEVNGDSMIGAGIHEGDLVLVKQQPDVEHKDIAVVMVNSADATLKRVFKQNGSVILQPENKNYDPIMIKSKDARIVGKVVGLTRTF